MKRRTLLAAIPALAAPRIGRAEERNRLVFAPVSDLVGTDPFLNATDITTHHVNLVFDTLFAMDHTLTPHPQMLAGATVEEDGRRWRLVLRDGLRFHDGEPVRADDAVASIQSWGRVDVFGRKLLSVTDSLTAPSDSTIEFRLKRPFPLLPNALAKPASVIPCIMPRRVAELAGTGKPIECIGSGPYRYLASERVAGARAVYEKFDGYVSRTETPDYLAGARVAYIPRIVWEVLPDSATAVAALSKGEIDWVHDVPPDLAPLVQRDRSAVLQIQDFIGGELFMKFNCLYPPFDDPAVRRAVLVAVDQATFMQAAMGDNHALWRDHVGIWSLGKPMSTDAGVDVMAGDIPKAQRLLAEAGGAKAPVVLLQPVDYPIVSAVAEVATDMLRRIGFTVDVVAIDYASANVRRNSRNPPAQGGWNVYFGPFNGYNRYDPSAHLGISSTMSGWPKLDEIEALRETWFDAPDLASRQAIARQIQLLCWRDVPYIPLGSYYPLTAFRKGLTGVMRGGATFFNVRWA